MKNMKEKIMTDYELFCLNQCGFSGVDLSFIDGRCVQTILRHIKKYRFHPLSKHRFSEYDNFFEKIDTPEKAYFIGWLISDGHLANAQVIITTIDHEVLDILNSILPGKVLYHLDQYHVNNIKIAHRLKELGIPVGKKNKITKPIRMNKFLLHHFWRGIFEGDGSVFVSNKLPRISISGSYDICKGFRDVLLLKNNKINRRYDSYQITWSSMDNNFWERIFKYLYDDYTEEKRLFLERKYKRINEIIGYLTVTTTLNNST
jgi:hypothetical protein